MGLGTTNTSGLIDLASIMALDATAATSSDNATETMRNWDLNRRMAGFWDPHMIIPMMQWLRAKQVYDDDSMKRTMQQLLSRTLMIGAYFMYTGESAPAEMQETVARVQSTFPQLEAEIHSFMICMITIGHERASDGPTSALDRKTIREWNSYWQARKLNDEEYKTHRNTNSVEAQKMKLQYSEFPDDVLKKWFHYCQLFYQSGDYRIVKKNLIFYLDHVCEFTTEGRERSDLRLRCIWGLLATMCAEMPQTKTAEEFQKELEDSPQYSDSSSEMNLNRNDIKCKSRQNIEEDDAYRIPQNILLADELIDSIRQTTREKILLERSWLIHWSIWPLLKYYIPRLLAANSSTISTNPRSLIPYHLEWTRLIDWLLSDRILNLIISVCPHLLRYIAVIAILNRQRQDHFKSAVDAIARAGVKYSDSFTTLLDSLFVKFDFDEAQEKLALCSYAAEADFLLNPLKAGLEENSRLLIFQTYCRIQKSINIDVIAKKLYMTSEIAERWIVNLIRHARLEGKIDSERNRVEIATQAVNVYQNVVDKTRNLVVRTNLLIQNLDRPIGNQPISSSGRPNGQTGADFVGFRQRRGVTGFNSGFTGGDFTRVR